MKFLISEMRNKIISFRFRFLPFAPSSSFLQEETHPPITGKLKNDGQFVTQTFSKQFLNFKFVSMT